MGKGAGASAARGGGGGGGSSSNYIMTKNSSGQELQIPRSTYEKQLQQAEKQLQNMYDINANPRIRSREKYTPNDFAKVNAEIDKIKRILRTGQA